MINARCSLLNTQGGYIIKLRVNRYPKIFASGKIAFEMGNSDDDRRINPSQKSFFDGLEDRGPMVVSNYPLLSDIPDEDLYVSLMALKSIKGLGFKTLCTLFDAGFVHHFQQWDVLEITRQWNLISPQIRINLDPVVFADKQALLDSGRDRVRELKDQRIEFVPQGSKYYPRRLLRLSEPPRWLFVTGNTKATQSESIIAVVGTRSSSTEGEGLARQCSTELVRRNIVVLSGLAKGIDENAHWGAVEHYGQSIAVLGHGMNASDGSTNNFLYQKILELDGAVISEYLPTDPPSRQSFLRRNELQVALARVVIPVECPSMESGTGATIRRAMSIGTPIAGVFPANATTKSIESTKTNLERLEIPVFNVRSENSKEFWTFLARNVPEHDWRIDPTERQERFLRSIESQILLAKKKVDLDEGVIDRFAWRLKTKLRD